MILQLLTILTVGICLVQARQNLLRFKRQAFQDDHLDCSHGQGYYQHPMDCRFYYRCWEHQDGDYQRFVFACPYFTVFDTEDNVCKLASLSAPCKTQEQRLIPVNNNNNNYNNHGNKNYPSTSKPGYNVPSSPNSYDNKWNKPDSNTKNNGGSTPDYTQNWSGNNNNYNPNGNKTPKPDSNTKNNAGTTPDYTQNWSHNNYNPNGNKSPKDNYEQNTNIPDYGSYHDYYPSTDYPDEDHHINNGYTKNGDNSNGGNPHTGYPKVDYTDYPDSDNGSPNSGSSNNGPQNTGYPNNGYTKSNSPNNGSPNNDYTKSNSPNNGSPNNGYTKGNSPNSGYPNNDYTKSNSPNNGYPNSGIPNIKDITTPKTPYNGYTDNKQTTVNMPKTPYTDIFVNVPNGKTNNENTLTGKINTPTNKSINGYPPAVPEPESEPKNEKDRPIFKTSTPSYQTNKQNSGVKYPTSDTSITLSPGSSHNPTPRQGGGEGISTAVTQVCQPPKVSVKPVFCQGNGFFRHPDNCSQFYQCLSNSYGDMESYVFNCPTGLVFQENGQQQCTHPEEVPECSQENNKNTNRPSQPKIY